jgi:flagellar protein FliS
MTEYPGNKAAKAYGAIAAHGGVEAASPHRLVQMLMEGALQKMLAARLAMDQGKTQAKGENISWAISIIDGLRDGLDLEKGGDIAANLDNLYEYMGRRLLEANLHSNIAMLDEVIGLLREIKAAWDAVPAQLQTANQAS